MAIYKRNIKTVDDVIEQLNLLDAKVLAAETDKFVYIEHTYLDMYDLPRTDRNVEKIQSYLEKLLTLA